SVPDRSDEIYRSPCELGTSLCGLPGFKEELPLGVGGGECAELRSPGLGVRRCAIQLEDLRGYGASTLIVAVGGAHQVATSKGELPHQVGRHVCVARVHEIAVLGAAYETGIARCVEPSLRFRVHRDRLAGPLLLLR